MTKIFKPLIGHTVEVYIDDIVVKRRTKSEDARHLEENFRLMKAYNMKLSPAKCAFGVSIGKFWRFLVTQRRIEVNPDQIKAIMETFPQSSKKRVVVPHRLSGCIGTLYNPFHKQAKAFFPHTKRSQHDRMDK